MTLSQEMCTALALCPVLYISYFPMYHWQCDGDVELLSCIMHVLRLLQFYSEEQIGNTKCITPVVQKTPLLWSGVNDLTMHDITL